MILRSFESSRKSESISTLFKKILRALGQEVFRSRGVAFECPILSVEVLRLLYLLFKIEVSDWYISKASKNHV